MQEHDSLQHLSLDSFEGIHSPPPPDEASIFSRLPWGNKIHALYPGLLIAITIGLAASWLSQHYGAPVMLFGLLLGMAFHFLHDDPRCKAGIDFSSRSVLRFGVALLGARITAVQIASLGLTPVLMVILGVTTTILFGIFIARGLGQSRQFGTLTACSVAICGASAALAVASVLPSHKDSERDTILTVVSVTALSTIAMIVYPIIANSLHLDHEQAGIFLGGTIHDVAQVVGAGYMISPQTGDIATYVKLLRVAMLLPVVLVITIIVQRSKTDLSKKRGPLLPWFLTAFALLVAMNSIGLLPLFITESSNDLSRWCLVTAIAGLGMKTSFKNIMDVGWRPIALMLAETIWIGLLVLIYVTSRS
jgi:uncharacterized integral membrane protein (TIGR00698 family)